MSETPKLFQNRVSESGSTLLVAAVYALVIWAAAGVVTHGWWLQMACMGLTTYIIVELTNTNALLRVRSRMISSTFLVLGCSANFLFPSLSGALASLLFTASLIPFFNSYQKANTQRELYVAFLAIGAASISDVVILWLVPVLWLPTAVIEQAVVDGLPTGTAHPLLVPAARPDLHRTLESADRTYSGSLHFSVPRPFRHLQPTGFTDSGLRHDTDGHRTGAFLVQEL